MKQTITTETYSFLGDLFSPISVVAGLREKYQEVFLLESTDYHGKENAISLIAFDSLASIKVRHNQATISSQFGTQSLTVDRSIVSIMNDFLDYFAYNGEEHPFNGIYGYTGFDAIQYFDTVKLTGKEVDTIPEIEYHHFRFILVINPLNHQCTLIENRFPDSPAQGAEIVARLPHLQGTISSFAPQGIESSNLTDDQFIHLVQKGKEHIRRGDVFQIVLSRRYAQSYVGDELNLYRSLRSINPSPYLFYFHFKDFRLLGSSPEAEIIIENGTTQIHPIAGTYRRSGNDETDREKALTLSNDPKEVAEHVMLVDLARNDLSRNCDNVVVKTFKEIQFFSHVIHLVSNVTGNLRSQHDAIQILTDTFPAGTLSGAPKYRAVQLIDQYEPHKRGFYGGAIGYIGFNGHVNHAILIRSFLAKDGLLNYQAGAGITIKSVDALERDEVLNKLAALKAAILKAKEL